MFSLAEAKDVASRLDAAFDNVLMKAKGRWIAVFATQYNKLPRRQPCKHPIKIRSVNIRGWIDADGYLRCYEPHSEVNFFFPVVHYCQSCSKVVLHK